MMLAVVALSTLGIDAFDNRHDLSGSLLATALPVDTGRSLCPEGMSYVQHPDGSFCIDTHTASAGERCPYRDPGQQNETRENLSSGECEAVSRGGRVPWRHISQSQAEAACRASGKYLPSNREWYAAAQGTPDVEADYAGPEDCNIDGNWPNGGGYGPTATGENCVSSIGAFDTVGNTWEWVDGTVTDGEFQGVELPESGYITSVDSNGVPRTTDSDEPDPNYNGDELWRSKESAAGVMRGGFYGSGSSAGVYAFHATMEPSFAGRAIGFRCASEPLR